MISNGGVMNKIYKLKSSKAFEYIHKHGKSYANNELVLIFAPTKFNLKVGFSVSKKIGKAVVRNKTKRRLREGFRQMIPFLNQHFNYVFIARQGAKDCDYHKLVAHLLHKAGLVENINQIDTIK